MGCEPNLGHIATLSGSRNNDLLYDFTTYVHIHFTSNYLHGFIFLPFYSYLYFRLLGSEDKVSGLI